MKFVGQDIQKLEPKLDRQTHFVAPVTLALTFELDRGPLKM